MTILYGLLGLSVIVFIHEAGHFAAARLFGVKVESFSIGMGPFFLHKTIRGTDYRLSLIPFGGYCGMKGEKDFQNAMEQKLERVVAEKDSFYGVHPFKRLCIAFAGPFANFVSAFVAFSVIAMTGYYYYTTPNKIILAEDAFTVKSENARTDFPASRAGLKTGDRIIELNGKSVTNFSDIIETVALAAREEVNVKVERGGNILDFTVVPELDKSSGAGKIGIVSWVEPIIENIVKDSPAFQAGLKGSDRIVELNGVQVHNTSDVLKAAQNLSRADIIYEREGKRYSAVLSTGTDAGQKHIIEGIQWRAEKVRAKTYAFFPALVQGAKETGKTLAVTVKSIGLLFKGVDVTRAVSGPIGISVLLGESAKAGFSESFGTGMVTVLNFLAVISLSLFFMNLLPIPVLDGSLILYALIELVRGTGLKPRTLYRIQFIGIIFIALIFAFGMFTDISKIIYRIRE